MHLHSEMKIRYDLIAQSFCVIKCYERIKEIEKAADIDLGRGGGEGGGAARVPPAGL